MNPISQSRLRLQNSLQNGFRAGFRDRFRISLKSRLHKNLPYILAMVATGAALGLTIVFAPWVNRMIATFFYLAVLFSAAYCGVRPAIVTVVLSSVLLNYYVMEPMYAFTLHLPTHLAQICIFNLASSVIIGLVNYSRLSQYQLEQLRQQLNHDIQTREQAESDLRASEEKFRQLAENIQDVFWILAVNPSHFIYVSPMYEVIWGSSIQHLYANCHHWFDVIHPDDRDRVETTLRQQFSKYFEPPFEPDLSEGSLDTSICQEYRILRPDGSIRWIRDRLFPIRSAAGITIRIAGISEDITNPHAIEQLKRDFISVVSHELRTPLTAIRGALGLLSSGIYDARSERQLEMLQIASNQSDRLVRLVNDILDLERLESGHVALRSEPCDITTLMQESIALLQIQADQAQIAIEIHPLSGQVDANPDAIVQTLTNLLSNAIKFSSPGSAIQMSAQDQADGMVQFSIADSGRGIPANQLDTIFGPFQQVDVSDSRDKGGTGLGLSICRAIVERHGGKIWVESDYGVGSTVFFTLRSVQ